MRIKHERVLIDGAQLAPTPQLRMVWAKMNAAWNKQGRRLIEQKAVSVCQ